MSVSDLAARFAAVGFGETKVSEIVKNKKVSNALSQALDCVPSNTTLDNAQLTLLHTLASTTKNSEDSSPIPKLSLIVEAVADRRLKNGIQLDAAVKYAKKAGENATKEELDSESGVGIELTRDDVKREISRYFEEHKSEIEEKRYRHFPAIMADVRRLPELKWASPAFFKPVIDELLLEKLGPKDERDVAKKEPRKAENKKKRSMFLEGFLGALHKVGENPQAYPELMKAHLEATKGKVHTRFPPEPNGFLHIGHSKAIFVNFGYAKYHNGVCYLRYDDTNPAKEEDIYFELIRRMVEWLGFEPWKVTYLLDYFDQLYELAEKLISVGKAYVDHCTPEEIQAQRGIINGKAGGPRHESPWSKTLVEENLRKFRAMRDGEYKPGEATLRMKQDLLGSDSPQMWDLIAYRVIDKPHPRTGTKWRIYPTYDFTHCLVDSMENITHSLCTTEFYLLRESYEWLCDAVHVFRPAQREYGRLNITGTVLSKRKIAKLVEDKHVRGWDDPRLFTLEAIKRRGVPPGAILLFISTLGVTRNDLNIQLVRFESAIRRYLEDVTPRLFFILDPIEVVLDVPEDFEYEVEMPYKSGKNGEIFGSRKVYLTKRVYIDRSDFRKEGGKDFFRLTMGQSVGLMKAPYPIMVTSVDEEDGQVVRIHALYLEKNPKPKTFIHWIAKSEKHNSPVRVAETRIHKALFKSENPSSAEGGFLADLNEDSETVLTNTIIEPGFLEIKKNSPYNVPREGDEFDVKEKKGAVESVRFQGMRVGYFALDKDSTDDKLVLNRIVSLREDSSKD